MDRVDEKVREGFWRRKVVAESTDRVSPAASSIRPHAEQVDEEVAGELDREHLRDDVEVRHERGLQDDGNVRRVEELDGVRRILATVASGLDGEINAETLENED